MGKQVYLHIGGEKTGTTTLQYFLTRNASELKRAGFHYPCESDDICFDDHAHFPIAASLIGEKVEFVQEERQRTLPFVLKELAQVVSAREQSIVLSCEHFSSRLIHGRQLETLRDALSSDVIKVIYYIREPSDLALSRWSTGVRCGGRFAFNPNDVTPEDRYFNHLKILNLWGSVFGDSNLIVREYGRTRLIDGDIRKDFCALLGIQTELMEFEKDENQSFDARRLQVLRYINCDLPGFFWEFEVGWRRAQNIRDLISAYIPSGGQLTALMSEQERTLIKSRFATVNSEISQRYFGGHLSRDWFPDCEPHTETGSQDSCDQDIATVLRETIIRMAEENIRMAEENNRMAENIRTAVEYETKRQERKSKRPLVRLKKKLKEGFVRSALLTPR